MLRTLTARFSLSLFLCLLCLAAGHPVIAANSSYTVQRGDTLFSIAQRVHVSAAQLARTNHLSDENYLREGQQLRLNTSHHTSSSRTIASKQLLLARTRLINRRIAAVLRSQGPHSKMTPGMSREDGAQAMAATQALWVATHGGSLIPGFSLSPAYLAAQRTLKFELRLTKTAMRFLGVPYAWGGTSFSGVDCSGFVQAVFHRNGIDLPRTADAQFTVGHPISQRSLLPGDLVFFQTYAAGASHVGIYVGSGNFVHASSSQGVRVDSLYETYYASRYIGARRDAI